MGRFYGDKIINELINPKTGKSWTIDDVPKLWKSATQSYIDAKKKSDSEDAEG